MDGINWGVQFSTPPAYPTTPTMTNSIFTVKVTDEATVRNYPVPQNGETFFIDETHGKAWLKVGNGSIRTFDLKETTPKPTQGVYREEFDSLSTKMDTILSMLRNELPKKGEGTE